MAQRLFILALLAAAACATPTYNAMADPASVINFGEALTMYWKAFQKMMPCGYAPENIPVLAPLADDHISFNYSSKDYSFVGNLSNYILTGLSDFRILGGSYDDRTQSVTYDMIFPQIQLLSEYELDAYISIGGYPLYTQQKGLINEKLVDLRIVGGFTLAPSKYNANGLRISDFNLNFYLADIELSNWNQLWDISSNNFANQAARGLLQMLVQQIQPRINDIYAQLVLPQINGVLQSVDMSELIDYLVSEAQTWNMADCTLKA